MDNLPKLLKVTDITNYLNVSRATVRRWIHTKTLPAIQFGNKGDYRIKEKDLINFLGQKNEN